MSKNILILRGSPRRKGNSAALANRLVDGAKEAGAQVEEVLLDRMKIRPCNACDLCHEKGKAASSRTTCRRSIPNFWMRMQL